MSEAEVQQVAAMVEAMEERLAKRLTECKSDPPPKDGRNGGNGNLRGWRAAAIILGVLTAVATPVLAVTWYSANRMNQLDDVRKDVDSTRSDMSTMRQEVGRDIGELRKDIQRLREAFAAYTQIMLPMIVQDDLPIRIVPPQVPQTSRLPQPVLPLQPVP